MGQGGLVMGGSPTPPSQDRTVQEIIDDETEEEARREQLAFNKRERQRVDAKFAETEAKLGKEKALTAGRKAQEKSARSRNLRGFPSLLGGGGFTGFTLEGDVERLRRAGLTSAENKGLAEEEAGSQRLAVEEAERQRLADAAAAAERQRKTAAAAVQSQKEAQKAVSSGVSLLASKDPRIRSQEALLIGSPLLASADPRVVAEEKLRTGVGLGTAEGQVSSRQLAEDTQRTKLVAGGFDPDDKTKSSTGADLTPLEVQKRIKATSFTGFNPPSLFDEFDPSNSLVRLGSAPTSRQREEERQKVLLAASKKAPLTSRQRQEEKVSIALRAKGFDPDNPTLTLLGSKLTPLQVQQRIRVVNEA